MQRTRIFRDKKGYALVSIMVIGFWATLFMLGIAASMLAVYENESSKRLRGELRNAAEIGIDYAINQLNAAATAGSISPIDVPAAGAGPTVSTIPANFLPSQNMTVQITVSKIPTTVDWQKIASWSSIYSAQLDASNSVSAGFTTPPNTNVQLDRWRILQATAQYQSGLSRTITTILQPRYDTPPGGVGLLPPGANQPYFNNAFFGNTGVAFTPSGGTLIVQGIGSPSPAVLQAGQYNYVLNVVTNETANIGTGTDLKGNLQVNSSGSKPTDVTAQANQPPTGQNVNLSTSAVVEGRATSDGAFSNSAGLVPTGTPAAMQTTDNVLANADQYNPANRAPAFPNLGYTAVARQGTNSSAPTAQSLSGAAATPQNLAAPGITASTSTPSLPGLTSLPESGGQAALAPGSYQTASLNTTGISNPVTVSSSSPTQIFVQGENNSATTSSTPAINVDSSLLRNSGDATNLQLWYSGSAPVNINVSPSSPFNGLIYAPNASVTISGSGSFGGAIVGSTVNVTMNGTMNLRTDLGNTATAGSLTYVGYQNSGDPRWYSTLTGYRSMTWQESR